MTRTREQIALDYYKASGRANSQPSEQALARIDAENGHAVHVAFAKSLEQVLKYSNLPVHVYGIGAIPVDPFQNNNVPCFQAYTQQQLDCGLYGFSNRYR